MHCRLTCRGASSPAATAHTFQNVREHSTACSLPISGGFDARKFFLDVIDCADTSASKSKGLSESAAAAATQPREAYFRVPCMFKEQGRGPVAPMEPDAALHSVVAGRNWIIWRLIFNLPAVQYFFCQKNFRFQV